MKRKYSTKDSDQSRISSISSELSNDSTSYLTVAERRKIAEEATLIALQAKELLEKKIEIEKIHLRNEEIEAQNRVELAELSIS